MPVLYSHLEEITDSPLAVGVIIVPLSGGHLVAVSRIEVFEPPELNEIGEEGIKPKAIGRFADGRHLAFFLHHHIWMIQLFEGLHRKAFSEHRHELIDLLADRDGLVCSCHCLVQCRFVIG